MSEAVSKTIHERIGAALSQIESEENATILLAIESGSRAWGFHSQDSDYDVRFLYARPVDWHLSVAPGRDVIERPIDSELDLSGWDLRKTLGLILKSNAVILEWLQSPIRYRETPELCDDLLAFCREALNHKALTWHYLRLGTRQREGLRGPDGRVKLKRYFYTLRPALALRWLRMHDGDPMVPMHMDALIDAADIPAPVRRWIDDLIAVKRVTGEMGMADTTDPVTDALLDEEFAHAERYVASSPVEPPDELCAKRRTPFTAVGLTALPASRLGAEARARSEQVVTPLKTLLLAPGRQGNRISDIGYELAKELVVPSCAFELDAI